MAFVVGVRPPTRGNAKVRNRDQRPREAITHAHHKAIDRIRRENKRDDKHKEAQMVYDDDPSLSAPLTTTGSG
ncbi:hypothetical protein [Rhodococcus sp. 21391]|uniref:hypothetical protein n=1 Tax=Rhodococcus sp. 21391 TaxID=2683591 RepID=UPI000AEFF1F8|nr:hypothetical protein [Rhodococcus sp. 21391]